ncbi:MAG: Fur family transcriptional regulator [Anaerolineae bacterium]
MACEELFLRELRKRGFRLTPQREMVLSALHGIEGHATAEEIYARVRQISSSGDISTVYRTLELLQEFDLVAAFDLEDGQRHYELLGVHGPHCHLVCRACGRTVGVDQEVVWPLGERLLQEYGFRADLDHLTIQGLCLDCQARLAIPEAEQRAA